MPHLRALLRLAAPALVALTATEAGASSRGAVAPRSVQGLTQGARRPPDPTAPDTLGWEPVLLDLRIEGVGARTVRAYRIGDEALLPAVALLELAEVRLERGPGSRIEGVVEPRGTHLVIDATGEGVVVDGRSRAARDALLVEEQETFVPSTVLGDALGTRIVVDWASLTASVTEASMLPAGRRAQRQRARARLASSPRPAGGSPGDVALALERPRLDGLVVDYAVGAGGATPLRAATYLVSSGANLLGGSLEASVAGASGRVQERLSWLGVWRGAPAVRQVRLGDGYSTGPHFRAIRGAMVTNAPFFRSPVYGALDFGGRLAPGWQLEVYRDGQLVAIDSTAADGSYGIALPATYGETAVDFVAYGPFGEEIAFNRSLSIPLDLLPRGRAEYGLAAGRCAAPPCEAEGNADLRYGVTDRWTMRGGVEHLRADSLGALTQPYAALTGSVTNALQLQLSGIARDNARVFVQYRPSLFLRLTAAATRFAGDRPALAARTAARSALAVAGSYALPRPPGTQRSALLDAAAEATERADGRAVRARLGVSTHTRLGRVTPYLRLERDRVGEMGRSDIFTGIEASLVPRGAHPLLRGLTVRAAVEGRDGAGVHATSVQTSKTLTDVWQLDVGGAWREGTAGPSLSFLLSALLPQLRSFTSVHAPAAGRATTTQYASGSLVWNRPRGHLALGHQPALQRAGVTGRVYVDANGNRRFDPGEEPVPQSYVRIGSQGAIADSGGRFELWDILPFEPVHIEVDSLTLPSPLWVPAAERQTAELGPNRFQSVDIPLVFGGTVEGRVRRDTRTGLRPMPAAPVTITELRTGRSRTVTAFNDGEFAAYALRPGDYAVTLADSLLVRLGLAADTARFTVRSLADGDRVHGIELTVRPRVPLAGPPGAGTRRPSREGESDRDAAARDAAPGLPPRREGSGVP